MGLWNCVWKAASWWKGNLYLARGDLSALQTSQHLCWSVLCGWTQTTGELCSQYPKGNVVQDTLKKPKALQPNPKQIAMEVVAFKSQSEKGSGHRLYNKLAAVTLHEISRAALTHCVHVQVGVASLYFCLAYFWCLSVWTFGGIFLGLAIL